MDQDDGLTSGLHSLISHWFICKCFSQILIVVCNKGLHLLICQSHDSTSLPVRAKPIISSDSSKVLARYTDHGLWRREARSLPPAMLVGAWGGVGGRPVYKHTHTVPCDTLLSQSTTAAVSSSMILKGDRQEVTLKRKLLSSGLKSTCKKDESFHRTLH